MWSRLPLVGNNLIFFLVDIVHFVISKFQIFQIIDQFQFLKN
jgi:hypothetical protein